MQKIPSGNIPPGKRFSKLNQLGSMARRLVQPRDIQKLKTKTGCRFQKLDNSMNTKTEMIKPVEIEVKPNTAVKIDSVHAGTGCCFVVGTNIKGETEVIRYSPYKGTNLRDKKDILIKFDDLFLLDRINNKTVEDGASATFF